MSADLLKQLEEAGTRRGELRTKREELQAQLHATLAEIETVAAAPLARERAIRKAIKELQAELYPLEQIASATSRRRGAILKAEPAAE
jgi:chromosome segregation ATPase